MRGYRLAFCSYSSDAGGRTITLNDHPRSTGRSAGAKLEDCTHAPIAEIAADEKINDSYVGGILRLTLLAPDIVEAILHGRQPARLQLGQLLRRFPVGWGGAAGADV